MDALMSATHVVTSVPPAGLPLYDPVTRSQLRLLRRRAEAAAAGDAPWLQWLGVLSSTSVYGDHGGDWVDERCGRQSNGATPNLGGKYLGG
jgi:hypothetical protein